MRRLTFTLLASVALTAIACSRASDAPTAPGGAATPLAASAPPSAKGSSGTRATTATVVDFVSGFDACTLAHRGILLDLGDPTMRARMASMRLKAPDIEVRE